MRTANGSHPQTVTPIDSGRHTLRDGHTLASRLRPQLIADGVVAGYIHDISTRHRDGDAGAESYELATEAKAA